MVPAHAAALSVTRLRRLARLHRLGVGGVAEELLGLAAEAPLQLAEALGRDTHWLDELSRSNAAANLIVASIEDAPRRARQARAAQARQEAEALAQELAERSSVRADGFVDLSLEVLDALVRCPGYRHLGLVVRDQVRVLERARLRAGLRECKNTQIQSFYLTPDALWLHYKTEVGRGHLCFVAERLRRDHQDVLIVPEFNAGRPARLVAVEADEPPLCEVPRSVPSPVPDSVPTRTVPARRPFLRHLLDALSEVVT